MKVKKLEHYKNIDSLCASAEQVPLKDSSFDYYIISFGIRNVTDIKKHSMRPIDYLNQVEDLCA